MLYDDPNNGQTVGHLSNQSLRKIKMNFLGPNTIRNDYLLRETGMIPTAVDIVQRRWRWIGHVLRMPEHSLPATALRLTSQ
jgi:hypothetical protein